MDQFNEQQNGPFQRITEWAIMDHLMTGMWQLFIEMDVTSFFIKRIVALNPVQMTDGRLVFLGTK